MNKTKTIAAVAAALACCAPAWGADVIQLKFEGLTVPVQNATSARPPVRVDQFYNGGQVRSASGDPVGPTGTPDLNVVVSGTGVVALEAKNIVNGVDTGLGGDGNFRSTGLDLGTGALGVFGQNGATTAIIDLVDGAIFNGTFSFFYAAEGPTPVTLSIGDANGSATFTETLSGSTICSDGLFCNWVSFALDTKFSNATRVAIVGDGLLIDNLTLGSRDPSTRLDEPQPPVPEPSTYALMAVGLAAAGWTARRRQRPA